GQVVPHVEQRVTQHVVFTQRTELRLVIALPDIFCKHRGLLEPVHEVVHGDSHFANLVVAEIFLLFFHQFATTELDYYVLEEVDRHCDRPHQQVRTHDTPTYKHCGQDPRDVAQTSHGTYQRHIGLGCDGVLHRRYMRENFDNLV